MREKHPLGRRLLALTAAVCTLGSLAVVPAANAGQATPDKPVAQQTTPQAGKADGAQKPETDAQPGNTGKPADDDTQQQPAADKGSADAAAQCISIKEAFPDSKFREYVSQNIDTDKDGSLSQAEREGVTSITIEDHQGSLGFSQYWELKSAKGLSCFPRLTDLNLSQTSISDLDLSANPALENVTLAADAHLSRLNVGSNTNLENLDLEWTSLAALTLPAGVHVHVYSGNTSNGITPQLLALNGEITESFDSGRAVVGDSLDLVKETGFSQDALQGHVVILHGYSGGWVHGDKAGTPKNFDGTVITPDKGSSTVTYLYFPKEGDRDKWNRNTNANKSNVPFMLVHVGFISPELDQAWQQLANADSDEFTADSWKQAEKWWAENWTMSDQYPQGRPAFFGFDSSKQDFWDYDKYRLATMASFTVSSGSWQDWLTNKNNMSLGDGNYPPVPLLADLRDMLRVQPKDVADVDTSNKVTIPSVRFASYYYEENGKQIPVSGTVTLKPGQTIVFKAKAKDSYKLADPVSKWQWTRTGNTLTVAPKEPVQNGDVLTVTSVTGVDYFYTYQEKGGELLPFGKQTSIRVGGRPVWVVAKPAAGYQFAKDQKTVFGPYSYTAPNPPDNGSNNGGNGNTGNNGGGTTAPSVTLVDVERFYNTRNGEHFYTSNPVERDVLRADKTWRDEGVAFRMSSDKGTPVYRLYNPGGKHLFTTSEKERDALIRAKWNYEGVAFYVPEGASVQVYRLYNPGNGDHLLTTGANERGVLVMHKWRDEGVAFKAE